MTLWTLGSWAALIAVALSLQTATPSGEASEAACDAAVGVFEADARAQRAESEAARDALLMRLDGLDRRYLSSDGACAARLWQQRVILNMLSDRHDHVIDAVTRFEATPAAEQVPDITARMYSNRAYAYYMIGETTRASEDTYRSAALAPRLGAPAAVASLSEAAESAALAQDWQAADAYIVQARTILRDSLPTRPDLAVRLGRLHAATAGLLSRRLRTERDSTARLRLARQLRAAAAAAVAILEETPGDDEVQAIYDQGDRALALGDGAYGAALLGDARAARRGIDAATALLSDDVRDYYPTAVLSAWRSRWNVEALLGDTTAAIGAASEARFAAADLDDIGTEAEALEALAGFHEDADALATAEQYYTEALRLREVQWQRTRLHDWSAAAFAEAQGPYRALARLYAQSGRAEKALAVLDASRARALRDLQAELRRRDTLTPAERLDADSLLEAVQTLYVAALREAPGAPPRPADTARLSALKRRIAGITGAERERIAPLQVPAVQRSLAANERVLVSYLLDNRHSFAFVATPDTLVAIPLTVTTAEVERWMTQAGGPWGAREDAALRLPPLHRLYSALVAPLTRWIPDSAGLVIVPDGPLYDLPFGLLLARPADTYRGADFLVRRHPVSVEMAVALVAQPLPEQRRGRSLVAFGRSEFGTAPSQWRSRGGDALADLPNVEREIEQVAEHAGTARLALDREATEARLDPLLDDARVVHLASHAQPNTASPALSRIFLWDDPDAPDDGVLHLFELQHRHLQSDLIVLSGCSTARGQAQPGEGTLSLQYGVRAAGARAALATLWPVDDRAMADVMDDFYAALAAGQPKDRALQQAQIMYLDTHDGLDASPYYWGALVLSGNADPVDLGGGVGLPLTLLSALGLGGLAWSLTRRRHARRPDAAL